jgi:DNA replication protein DnaC
MQNSKPKGIPEPNKSVIRGFTQVDNFLLDDVFPLVGTKFPKYPSVLLAVIRKTIGWHKDSDWISLTQLERQSGARRKCVVAAVSFWCQTGLVRKEGRSGPRGTVRYAFISDYDPAALTSILRELVKPPDWFPQETHKRKLTKQTKRKKAVRLRLTEKLLPHQRVMSRQMGASELRRRSMPDSGACGKCGVDRLRRYCDTELEEPWCSRCASEHRSEYRPVYASWVESHRKDFLASMRVPPVYRSCSLETFEATTQEQKHALHVAQEWLTSEVLGLFLCGPCGTGKTHLAIGALLAMRAKRWSGRFASSSEFLFRCRNSFRKGSADNIEEIISEYCGSDVLLLDDLGAEKPTEFSRETLGLVVDKVYREMSCLIVTSNFDLNGLAERIDERTADRLVDICRAVKLSGRSFRQKRALERAKSRNLPTSEQVQ